MGGCATREETYRGKSYDGRSNSYEPVFDGIKNKKSPRRNRSTSKNKRQDDEDNLEGRGQVSNGVLDMRRKSQFRNKNTSRIQSSKIVQNRELSSKPHLARIESEQPKMERTIIPRMNKSSINSRSNSNEQIPNLFVTRPQSPRALNKSKKQPEFLADGINQKRSPEFNMVGQQPKMTATSHNQPFFVPNQPPGIDKDFNYRAQANIGEPVTYKELMSRQRSESQISTSGNFHPITNQIPNGRSMHTTMNPINSSVVMPSGQPPIHQMMPMQQRHSMPQMPPPMQPPHPPTGHPPQPYIPNANMATSQMVSSSLKNHPPIRPSSYLSASIIMSLRVEMEEDQQTLEMQRFDYVRRIPF